MFAVQSVQLTACVPVATGGRLVLVLGLLRSRLLRTGVVLRTIGRGRRTVFPRDSLSGVDPSAVLRDVVGSDSADAVDMSVVAGASIWTRTVHCNEIEAWRWAKSAWATGDDRSGRDNNETFGRITSARATGEVVRCGVCAGAVALFGSCALLWPLVATFVSFVGFRFEVWRTGRREGVVEAARKLRRRDGPLVVNGGELGVENRKCAAVNRFALEYFGDIVWVSSNLGSVSENGMEIGKDGVSNPVRVLGAHVVDPVLEGFALDKLEKVVDAIGDVRFTSSCVGVLEESDETVRVGDALDNVGVRFWSPDTMR